MISRLKKLKSSLVVWSAAAVLVGLLAVFSRLYQLGQVPAGITWDEAALGYVGKMVLLTRHDEHGQFLPLTFQSFGDYKAPLAFYFTGLSTGLFGLSAWAVRLPFAIAGIISVGLMGVLTWQQMNNRWYALLASFIMTVLPWHFYFSRVAFESGVALFGYLLLLIGWLGWLKIKTLRRPQQWLWPALVVSGTIINLYVYHSGKIVLPLTWAVMAIYSWYYHRSWFWKNWRIIGATTIATFVLTLPLLWEMISGPALNRATQTSFLGQVPLWRSCQLIVKNLLTHLGINFLTEGQTSTLRHSGGQAGVLLYSQLIFLWLGITFAVGKLWQQLNKAQYHRWWQRLQSLISFRSSYQPALLSSWLWLVFLVINLLPAAIGNEVPHANRALLAIVPVVVLSVLGVRELSEEINHNLFATITGSLVLFMILEWSSFWQHYFTDYAALSSAEWLNGYQEAVRTAQDFAQQGKKVKFSSYYGQPDIFYAFYNQVPVEIYQQQRITAIDFGQIRIEDLNNYDVIFSTPNEPLPLPANINIYRPDNSIAFQIYENF